MGQGPLSVADFKTLIARFWADCPPTRTGTGVLSRIATLCGRSPTSAIQQARLRRCATKLRFQAIERD
jgi:hypothetical protein